MENLYFGIDVGGTTVKIGMFQGALQLVEKWEIPTRREEDGAFILKDIAQAVSGKCSELGVNREDVEGIGLGIPGPVTEDGTVLKCANLGWGIVPVAEELSKLTGVEKIKAANDANVAALGEMHAGGGKGFRNLVMVTLGTGVGGGVILDGKILSGNKGAAGEIGHLLVNPDETECCGCGKKGCLEQYASATGVVRLAKQALCQEGVQSSLLDGELSAKSVFDCAKNGDKVALDVVDCFGRYLAVALAQVAQVIDPEVFVIGGGVSAAGTFLLDAIQKYYDDYVLFALRGKQFCLAQLGNDAGIYGSAGLIAG